MNRNRLIAALIVVAALLYLAYVFLVTGGPEVVDDGIAGEQAVEGDATGG